MHDTDPARESLTYRELLRSNANFRRIWIGEVVSDFGDWFNVVASATLVAALTGSGTAVGGLFAIRMLAPFLVSPVAGVLADRYDRKLLMVFADLTRFVVVLGFLLVRHPGEIWLLYVLTALQLGLSGFFVPARNAILPDVVPDRDLGRANALSSATYAIMLAFGAGIGGLVAGSLGVSMTFMCDAVSFLVSAVFVVRVRYRSTAHVTDSGGGRMLQRYVAGLRYLRADPETFLLVLHKGVNALLITGGLNVFVVTLAVTYFPVGERGSVSLGLGFCATGVGTALGPIVARRLTGDRVPALRWGLVVCYLVSAFGIALIAPALSLVMVLVGLVVRGIGGGMMFVFSTHLLMLRVPSAVRGRVFSTEFAARTLLSALGTMAISFGVDTSLGTIGMLWVVAALALLPAGLWWLWIVAAPRPAVSLSSNGL